MNSTVELIFSVFGGAMVLLSLYGAATSRRRPYLSGLCFFSLLPIIGESTAYNTDKAPVHILMIFLALVQLVLTIPDKKLYGRDNPAAASLAAKIGLGTIVTNAAGAAFVLCLTKDVPAQFGYYHIAFILIIIYTIVKGFSSSTSAWK
jgi:uncharacterized membrane protein